MIPSIYELSTFCHGQCTDCLIYQEKEKANSTGKKETRSALEEKQTKLPDAMER